MSHAQRRRLRRPTPGVRLLLAAVVVASLGGPITARAAAGLTMEAKVLLDGHARTGSWMAIDIHIVNAGPAIQGEVRLAGGVQGRTRFSVPADLPTTSDKTLRLYAQPPAFGKDVTVTLVEDETVIATTKAALVIHDPTQLVVGIVAERPGDIIGSLNLLPNQNNVAPLTVPLDPEDLPERVQAWGTLDRLVWQDSDSSRLSTNQLEAMRGWIASGGRLVIVGGTAGPSSLSGFPDRILPFRPTATTDIAASTLGALVGTVPADTPDLPALTGTLAAGRVLASADDRVIAAELTYGSGAVTVVGFDPTVSWIAKSDLAAALWRRMLPVRSVGGPVIADDSQIVAAASQLSSLALPPIGGLIALLGAYILLIGPINYLVLRRLDRRELAWVTMPVLIVLFAVGAYAFGSLLRGSDLIINEVAIVRGAPGATEGTAQAYLGIFSPSRGTYQLRIPGGALLSTPLSGDFFGGDGTAASLDVTQGDPAEVRDLAVGFGSLRTVRAEIAVEVPLVESDLRLQDGRLRGTVKNTSTQTLLKPAVVLGGTVASLADLGPGQTATVDAALQPFALGQSISDKIVGQQFFEGPPKFDEDSARQFARRTIVDQLTYDPNFGSTGQLPVNGAVILAWSDQSLVPVEITGQAPKRTGNILYFLPTTLVVRGTTTFRNDLLTSTVISADSGNFNKDPYSISFGKGKVELSYRPIAFDGTIAPTQLTFAINSGEQPGLTIDPVEVKPLDQIPPPCDEAAGSCQIGFDGVPELEVYDLTAATWRRLPHLQGGKRYAVAEPQRYVDPASGTARIRFVNDRSDGVGFQFDVTISGDMK